jgi:hypothetical protein
MFFGCVHELTDNGRWCWGGDFAAPREVVAAADGALHVRLPEAVASAIGSPGTPDADGAAVVELAACGTAVAERLDVAAGAETETYLARFEFAYDEVPAAFGRDPPHRR